MNLQPRIRAANASDLPALLALRNWYIAHSQASFDEVPLSAADLRAWMAQFDEDGPHRLLVALQDDRLLGYCSSQPYRAHPAFRQTIETSIYVAPGAGGQGLGSALYEALFAGLRGQDLHRVVVGIALPNEASIRLHERFSFHAVGIFDEYALKNGRRISSQWMQRSF